MTVKWQATLVRPDMPIMQVIEVIDKSSLQAAVVVDDERRFLGMVTDGDVRRTILRNIPLTDPVGTIMSTDCTVAAISENREQILAKMRRAGLRHIPVLDEAGRMVDLKVLLDLFGSELDNLVVIMAGGLGTRLRPLTYECPKPLLNVGGKPLLETIVENFIEFGARRFMISVNYMAEMIENHFGDGSRWGVEIAYLREDRQLGTAGALGLLPHRPEKSFFVMNADLLTKLNVRQLLDFHLNQHAAATMCVRDYQFQCPYGVAEISQHRLRKIVEKPIQQFFVNAGIYVLEPETLDCLTAGRPVDMPSLFNRLIEEGKEVVTFPIREYWLDIGELGDLKKANGDYGANFGCTSPVDDLPDGLKKG